MIDAKEKTLRDFVHEAIVPLIEDVLVKKLYQALEVVVSEIKPPRKEWVGLTDEELNLIYAEPQTHVGQYARAIEAKLKEKNGG
jgi:hypothetical protein